jgi:hypothetical protein
MQRVARTEGRIAPVIEILPVYLHKDVIRWLRPPGSESLKIDAPSGGHPGDAVVAALARYGVSPDAVHSTSWRTEDDRLVVTYLAVLPPFEVPPAGMRTGEVLRTELARGSATGPPEAIGVTHVVEHALRHLAWLIKDDPVIRDLLAPTWAGPIEGYTPEPFRSLDTSGRVQPAS